MFSLFKKKRTTNENHSQPATVETVEAEKSASSNEKKHFTEKQAQQLLDLQDENAKSVIVSYKDFKKITGTDGEKAPQYEGWNAWNSLKEEIYFNKRDIQKAAGLEVEEEKPKTPLAQIQTDEIKREMVPKVKKKSRMEVARENHLRNLAEGKIGDGTSSAPGKKDFGRI